jgi:hypothetical protein
MFYGIRSLPQRFRLLLSSCQQSDSLSFSDALTQEQIQAVCEQHDISHDDDEEVFTPSVVIWGFLSQVIHKKELRTCLAAVARIGVMLIVCGRPRCAQNNGPYCRARCRLPVAIFEQLTLDLASRCESQLPEEWLWKGRHVKLIDGTTVTMPDTEENQEAFPQQSCQKKGLGFPIARMVVVLSLATAMVSGMAMGPFQGKETGELARLRELLDRFEAGDIALADKLYCAYFMIALLLERKVDLVTLLHQARDANAEIRAGKRLGKGDYLITWHRPDRSPWMDEETYARMPEQLELRLIRVKITEPGFRSKSLDIVTTLTDSEQYHVDDLSTLYRQRWEVELDIRSIKVTMGMDELRCKTPEMVRKEIWACLLAYNLIRQKMLQSAKEEELLPRKLSFANGLQTLAAGWMVIPFLDRNTQSCLLKMELVSIASQTVGNRPGRVEPRAVKKRPKAYRLLTMMRSKAQSLLARGIDPYKKQK